ncbi:MAG: helix-turn-helix domain-containing protein [Solirubrobacteraceae bacterium]
MDRQSLEQLLEQGLSVERIARRFGKDPSTVSYWMKKLGLSSPYAQKHAAKGGIGRERLEGLIDGGSTVAQIAEEVGLSKGTVRHWMRVYGLRTHRARGERVSVLRAARDAGLLTVRVACRHHGESEHILEGRGYYRCKRCRADAVVRHRQKMKAILVKEAGGQCVLCGYSRSLRALQFHHLDPGHKRLGLSSQGVTYSLEALRAEAAKCVLLCGNCHVEVETGAASLPLEFCRIDSG